jgi:16S rRNA (guanine527-N7)-methyltransferase
VTPRQLLIKGAEQLGIALTIEQVNSLFIYLAELKKWNQKMNLTAISDEQDIIIKHALDSLSYLRGFDPARSQRLLDIGSGAGFPAIPIKIIHPEIEVILVESIKKKASFLRHIIRTLKLANIEVIDKRIEDLSKTYHEVIDIITARAFANMKSVVSTGLPFLKPGGLMVLSRGPKEMLGTKDLKEHSVTLEKRLEFSLPYSEYQRALWVFKKAL